MHKISIKNFGPIEEITDLEVNRVMVLIGQQATGKSTLSKVVYFFQTILEDVALCLKKKSDNDDVQSIQDSLKIQLKQKFYKYFGLVENSEFEIVYNYSEDTFIKISHNNDGASKINFSEDFNKLDELKYSYRVFAMLAFLLVISDSLKKKFNNDKLEEAKADDELMKFTKAYFEDIINLFKFGEIQAIYFIPAGRSSISSVKSANQSKFLKEAETEDYFDLLFRKFIERIDTNKRKHLFGKSLLQVIQSIQIQRGISEIPYAKPFLTQMSKVLKGEYQLSNGGEKIVLENGQSISMDYASSGQEETLWIMLDLFIAILKGEPAHFTIEEPEAHLYPIGQRNMVNLFSLFLAANPHNQLLITTHSPYILTAFNNLLFAGNIEASQNGVTKQKVEAILKGGKGLKTEEFEAYMMKGGKCKSIFNDKTGMIAENELDDASDEIMETFDELMELYKK